jgi:hypothetical protein
MKIQDYKNRIIIAVFILSIVAPLVAMIFRLDSSTNVQENRLHAAFPPIKPEMASLKKFPHLFYVYFRDNFGFRGSLIKLNYLVRRSLLRETEFNDVLFGSNGWLYYLGEHEMDDAIGITKYDEQTMQRWSLSLENKRKWLASRGIRYLLVIPPNKASIYNEYIPSYFGKLANITALDELLSYIETHTNVEMIDLRNVLLGAKSSERLYMKSDTHWNDYGAFVAYQEIIKIISLHISSKPPATLADFFIERKTESGGNLAIMAGGAEFIKEEQISFIPKKARLAKQMEMDTDDARTYAMGQEDDRLPTAVVFGDSMFDALIPFISEHFKYAQYYRKHWNNGTPIADIVSATHPDIVIEEFVERRIKMDMSDFTHPD